MTLTSLFQRSASFPTGLLCLAACGCAGYTARPISDREVLRELEAIRLEALQPASPAATGAGASTFDASDGISADEAVAAALFLNPRLRAFRRQLGVADGELVAAGLLQNPELEVTWLHLEHFTNSLATSGFDVALNWAPPRPGELAAKEDRAQARLAEVSASIAGEEWRLAADVRKGFWKLLAAGERLRLAEASLRLRERVREVVRSRRDLGEASGLDVSLAELERAQALRERDLAGGAHDQARIELSGLLGLHPRRELKLQGGAELLEYRAVALEEQGLDEALIARRPDLQAARQAHEQAEASLRLAYLRRWPWFRFGPAYARDEIEGSPGNRWGLGLGIDLPFANWNQGEIATLEAEREAARERHAAAVQQALVEVESALARLRTEERLLGVFAGSVRPAIEESERLIEAAVQLGELDVLQLLTVQDRALKARGDLRAAQLDYWQAVFDLERAVGARLSPTETVKG